MLLADGEDEIDAQIDAHIEDRPEALIIIFLDLEAGTEQ